MSIGVVFDFDYLVGFGFKLAESGRKIWHFLGLSQTFSVGFVLGFGFAIIFLGDELDESGFLASFLGSTARELDFSQRRVAENQSLYPSCLETDSDYSERNRETFLCPYYLSKICTRPSNCAIGIPYSGSSNIKGLTLKRTGKSCSLQICLRLRESS